jgi:cytochrome b6-f complex iron-sulfur subunit
MSNGNVAIQINGYSDPNCGASDVIVFQSGGQLSAFSAGCPHACCTVSFNGGGQWVFQCPCHGAQFDATGKSAGIRTNTPLAQLQVCQDANGVYVSY